MIALGVLLKYWHFAALAALLAFGAFELHAHNASEVAKGQALERARIADSTLAVLKPQLVRAESVYIRDTIRLIKTLTRTSVLRDTLLLHLTDTVRVKEFIAQTTVDSAACFEAARSCAADKALLTQEIVALRAKAATVPAVLDTRHWYSDRVSAGPCVGVDVHGKAFAGGCAQLSLFRFP